MDNYFVFDGLFYLKYFYVDAQTDRGYVADSCFYKRKIPVKYGGDYVRDDDKYIVVTCKIRKKYRKPFEEALKEIRTKMALLGYNDYDEYCASLKKAIEER